MTAAGFDVHARSIDGAAVHVPTGELLRIRFGGGVEGPIEWLRSLPGPVRACYECDVSEFAIERPTFSTTRRGPWRGWLVVMVRGVIGVWWLDCA